MRLLLLYLLAFVSVASAELVTVLGINDMHANIDALPRLAAFLKAERDASPELLLLSAGDNRTGDPYVDHGEKPGVPMIRLMNRLGFDLSTLGNHEFDSGHRALQANLDAARFGFVCANVRSAEGAELNLKPYHIFERQGVRIGVLGLVQVGKQGLPDANPANCRGLIFRDPLAVARDYAYLRGECDVLILLTHLGLSDDRQLARIFPEADAIIGGHSHTRVDGAVLENGVLITQAEYRVSCITRLTFDVENGKVLRKTAELIPLSDYTADPDMQAAVDAVRADPAMNRRLTLINPAIRSRESLGCLMADAMRSYTRADVAVVNAGNVRIPGLPEGPFTVADCYRLDPFCNSMVVFRATGRELLAFLNSVPEADHYGAPYVSGMRYKAVKPAAERRPMRITEAATEDGRPIEPDALYTVVTNSYLMATVPALPADRGRPVRADVPQALIRFTEGRETAVYADLSRIEVTESPDASAEPGPADAAGPAAKEGRRSAGSLR